MKQFAHLHVHTEFSFLDGAVRIDKVFKLCDEKNISAMAMTDNDNLYGAIEFLKAAVKHTDKDADFWEFITDRRPFKIKPIIGCEVNMTDDMHGCEKDKNGTSTELNHLVLLAKNEAGYRNLIKIVSASCTESIYKVPCVDFELIEAHSEGIIVLSGCLAGVIPQAILKKDFDAADGWIKRFKAIFGEDFYIEIQNHGIDEQKIVLPHLISLAKRNGVKVVATNDVYYLTKPDAEMQKVLQAISNRSVLKNDDSEAVSKYLPTDEFYLKDYNEMYTALPYEDALSTTLKIADKCDPYVIRKESLLPCFVSPNVYTNAQYLRTLTFDGLKLRYSEITDEIKTRAEHELDVIENLHCADYFLIVWDIINYAKSQGIPVGTGRGSSASSIVAYALGITEIDPLKYSLIFESFLNPECIRTPDFDIDFCMERRGEVFDYVTRKYGTTNVSHITTYGKITAKTAVEDVGRVYGYSHDEIEKITKLIPFNYKHLAHILGLAGNNDDTNSVMIKLRDMYEKNKRVRKIFDMAMKIEGMPRNIGMHAAGVIICRDSIIEHVPLARTDEGVVTQYDATTDEELGLYKIDFLGLTALTDIKRATDYIKERHGVDIDFAKLDYDDSKIYEMIGGGDTEAVFMLETDGMKRLLKELQPSCMEDIIAAIALYRPELTTVIPEFIRNKNNLDEIVYAHPLLEPILENTYGIIIYHEQVTEVLHTLGGYSPSGADKIRRMLINKKFADTEADRKIFINGSKERKISGAVANGIHSNLANSIYDMLIKFASYGFNKSHAAAYAHIAYQTAYLKCYYPAEYFAAMLNNRKNIPDELTHYLSYMKEAGIPILPLTKIK